jgi:predicted enzyme related to lactoylglutathione lyase
VRSKSGDPADFAGDLNEWVWLDLWTHDVDRATKFYASVVGYQVVPLESDGPRDGARLVASGYVRAGVMQIKAAGTTAVWLPYVRVADVRATVEAARAAGGKVLREPVSMGAAAVAVVADPTGAPVGVAQLGTAEVRP